MLILPQILQNYRSQSTKGLSRPLVVLNLSGDIFKLIYFLMKVFLGNKIGSSISVYNVRDYSGDFGQFCGGANILLRKTGG
jgi:hypothetical protein